MNSFVVHIQDFSAEKSFEATLVRNVSCIDLKSIFSVCVYCFTNVY